MSLTVNAFSVANCMAKLLNSIPLKLSFINSSSTSDLTNSQFIPLASTISLLMEEAVANIKGLRSLFGAEDKLVVGTN